MHGEQRQRWLRVKQELFVERIDPDGHRGLNWAWPGMSKGTRDNGCWEGENRAMGLCSKQRASEETLRMEGHQ